MTVAMVRLHTSFPYVCHAVSAAQDDHALGFPKIASSSHNCSFNLSYLQSGLRRSSLLGAITHESRLFDIHFPCRRWFRRAVQNSNRRRLLYSSRSDRYIFACCQGGDASRFLCRTAQLYEERLASTTSDLNPIQFVVQCSHRDRYVSA